ncbi:MAG TPA: hypothetical protein VMR51_00265 [Patescibacteria group bacterium]|nr:hypothetical protein [Patescibacteria group bacterium]
MSEQTFTNTRPPRQFTDIETNNRRFLDGFLFGHKFADYFFAKHQKSISCHRIKELCQSIADESDRNWTGVFLAVDEIDKLAQKRKPSYSEQKMPGIDKNKVLMFNHFIRECIKEATATTFTFKQTVNTIANSIYPARKGPNDEARQRLIDELASVTFGMWHEQSLINLLKTADVKYFDATTEEDETGVDVFIATENNKWIGVDIKSHMPQSVRDRVSVGGTRASIKAPIIGTGTNDKGNVILSADYGIKGIPDNMLLSPLKFSLETTPDAIEAIWQACESVSYTKIREYDRKGDTFIPCKIVRDLGRFAL